MNRPADPLGKIMSLNYQALLDRHFEPRIVSYDRHDCVRFAEGFGAGQSADLQDSDRPFLDQGRPSVLPMIAVPLADGEFWQQDPATGIEWQKIVHASESIQIHQPLSYQGTVVVTEKIKDIYDRGPDKGAVMVQEQQLIDKENIPLATIEVTTVLRGNGGFGGQPAPTPSSSTFPERQADHVIDIPTPTEPDTPFRLMMDLDVASTSSNGDATPAAMIRGVGCFGLAGRGAIKLVCNNDPKRVKAFGVRYAGPMFTGETMRMELWETEPGAAVFRVKSVERNAPVLKWGFIDYGAN